MIWSGRLWLPCIVVVVCAVLTQVYVLHIPTCCMNHQHTLSLSLSLSHTHTLSSSLSLTHTLTHTHSHTHTLSCAHTLTQREDVTVITANPKTAGVARWNFLGLWGHRMGKGDAVALKYCTNVCCWWGIVGAHIMSLHLCMMFYTNKNTTTIFLHKQQQTKAANTTNKTPPQVFKQVAIQPRDAREASDVFLRQAVADVLLTYENEIVLTNKIQPETALPYIAPDNNVLVCRSYCASG